MTTPNTSPPASSTLLDQFYTGWEAYQQMLVKAVAPLTPDQLALRAAPHMRTIGELAAHILGCRAGWFHFVLREGGAEFDELAEWDIPNAPARNAAELEEGLETTWRLLKSCLTRWTPADLDATFTDPDDGQTFTRRWVVWHVLEHDLHHGGELSLSLGIHHLAGLEDM
ncbi:MAG: DinB family protein [Ktedonobacterales bacterium]